MTSQSEHGNNEQGCCFGRWQQGKLNIHWLAQERGNKAARERLLFTNNFIWWNMCCHYNMYTIRITGDCKSLVRFLFFFCNKCDTLHWVKPCVLSRDKKQAAVVPLVRLFTERLNCKLTRQPSLSSCSTPPPTSCACRKRKKRVIVRLCEVYVFYWTARMNICSFLHNWLGCLNTLLMSEYT